MILSKHLVQHCRRGVACLASVLVGILVLQTTFSLAAQSGYESVPVLSASKILPPELLAGPNHHVQERVVNDGFLNTYTIDSKFGQFKAVSTALLRERIQEINAMAQMDKLKGTKEYGTAVKESALSAMVAAKDMVFQPVSTLKTAASGVAVAFRRAGDSVFGAKRSDAEDSKFKNLIGFSNYKREYAYDLGVDVYSRNEVLQDRLNEISWVGWAGGLTVSAAMAAVPGGAGIAMTAIGTTRLTREIVKNQPPADLRRTNTEKLKSMGIDPSTVEMFINESIFSPREQTILVSALDEMKGVGDRERFVQLAALTNNVDMARFRQRQSEMYAGYHKAVSPLTQLVSVGQVPAARAKDGALVFNFPIDYLVWTDSLARLVANTDNLANQLPGVTRKEMWITGSLSPKARTEMKRMGWVTFENAETLLVAQDKSVPTYRKEGQQPDATVKIQSKSIALGAGVNWGDGVLTYQGKDYPITVSGLSLLDLGVSNVSATGKVYFLNKVSDFSGNYFATQATFALAGGGGEIVMANGNGVFIAVQSEQSGTRLTLGASGVGLKLK
ncbi:MAG: hypothetical protein E6J74_29265 [Deltaproteobacteria bacterium]|nr:MAG: hypothetical protein E6J74_29265 [Deltaproteobacteria bacterium]